MAITKRSVDVAGNFASVIVSQTITYSGAVTAGDLLAMALTYDNGIPPTVVISDSVNGVWPAPAAKEQDAGNGQAIVIYYFENSGAGTPIITINLGVTVGSVGAIATAFGGVLTSASLDSGSGSTAAGSSTSASTTSKTPSVDGCLILQACEGQSGTYTAGAGMTIISPAGVGNFYGFEYQIQTTKTAINPAMTVPSGAWGAASAFFKPAGGGGGGSTAPRKGSRMMQGVGL